MLSVLLGTYPEEGLLDHVRLTKSCSLPLAWTLSPELNYSVSTTLHWEVQRVPHTQHAPEQTFSTPATATSLLPLSRGLSGSNHRHHPLLSLAHYTHPTHQQPSPTLLPKHLQKPTTTRCLYCCPHFQNPSSLSWVIIQSIQPSKLDPASALVPPTLCSPTPTCVILLKYQVRSAQNLYIPLMSKSQILTVAFRG